MEIKEIRIRMKLTRKEFADLLEVSEYTVQSWELNRRNTPKSIIALACLLEERHSGKQ
jgi:DNA-binding transcriptional regulator YiaG